MTIVKNMLTQMVHLYASNQPQPQSRLSIHRVTWLHGGHIVRSASKKGDPDQNDAKWTS